MKKDKKTAVIYARYSSERQTEQSIEGQIHVCTDFAARNDIVIVDTYIDRAMTGTNDNRKDFQRMLKDSAKQAWDYVLVYKLDRFSRNKYETAMHKKTLRDNGIKLLSAMENIPETPEGIILESLLEGMAEYYSAELSQKVKRGMRELRTKGNYMGGYLLFGYKKDGKKVVIDEEKANIVKYIYDEYLHGTYIKTIIENLTAKGIYHRGKPFAVNTIHHMLENEKYTGSFECNGEIVDNIFPAIISKETFLTVQEKKYKNKYGTHNADVTYILKNKLFCGYCGKTMSADAGTARSGDVFRYYKCSRKKNTHKCKKGSVKKEIIEETVINSIIDAFNKNDLNKLVDKIVELNKEKFRTNTRLTLLSNQKADIEKSINNLILAMERGIFSDMTKIRLDELEGQLSLIKEQILHEEAQTKVSLSKEDIIAYIKSALKKEAKRLINLLVEKIILYENKIEIFYKYQKTKSPDETSQGFLFYQNTIFYNKTRVVKNVYIKKTNFTEEKFDVFHHF